MTKRYFITFGDCRLLQSKLGPWLAAARGAYMIRSPFVRCKTWAHALRQAKKLPVKFRRIEELCNGSRRVLLYREWRA